MSPLVVFVVWHNLDRSSESCYVWFLVVAFLFLYKCLNGRGGDLFTRFPCGFPFYCYFIVLEFYNFVFVFEPLLPFLCLLFILGIVPLK